MTVSCTLNSSHSTLAKLTCDCRANASASSSIFVSSDVILFTLFHSSPSATTSCCFCIPHACVHFFSSMLLASVHHPDFMAHNVSASQNLDSELPLGICPPGLLSALDRLHRRHRVHRAGVLSAFCIKNCCSPMLIVKDSSHCLHAILSTEEDLRGNTAVLVERGVRLNASANSLNTLAVKGKGGGLGGRSI